MSKLTFNNPITQIAAAAINQNALIRAGREISTGIKAAPYDIIGDTLNSMKKGYLSSSSSTEEDYQTPIPNIYNPYNLMTPIQNISDDARAQILQVLGDNADAQHDGQ